MSAPEPQQIKPEAEERIEEPAALGAKFVGHIKAEFYHADGSAEGSSSSEQVGRQENAEDGSQRREEVPEDDNRSVSIRGSRFAGRPPRHANNEFHGMEPVAAVMQVLQVFEERRFAAEERREDVRRGEAARARQERHEDQELMRKMIADRDQANQEFVRVVLANQEARDKAHREEMAQRDREHQEAMMRMVAMMMAGQNGGAGNALAQVVMPGVGIPLGAQPTPALPMVSAPGPVPLAATDLTDDASTAAPAIVSTHQLHAPGSTSLVDASRPAQGLAQSSDSKDAPGPASALSPCAPVPAQCDDSKDAPGPAAPTDASRPGQVSAQTAGHKDAQLVDNGALPTAPPSPAPSTAPVFPALHTPAPSPVPSNPGPIRSTHTRHLSQPYAPPSARAASPAPTPSSTVSAGTRFDPPVRTAGRPKNGASQQPVVDRQKVFHDKEQVGWRYSWKEGALHITHFYCEQCGISWPERKSLKAHYELKHKK